MAHVAEAAGNRTEGDRGAQRHVADGMQQVEESIALNVEDKVELSRFLVRQRVASVQARGMQQDIDAATAPADLVDHSGHRSFV